MTVREIPREPAFPPPSPGAPPFGQQQQPAYIAQSSTGTPSETQQAYGQQPIYDQSQSSRGHGADAAQSNAVKGLIGAVGGEMLKGIATKAGASKRLNRLSGGKVPQGQPTAAPPQFAYGAPQNAYGPPQQGYPPQGPPIYNQQPAYGATPQPAGPVYGQQPPYGAPPMAAPVVGAAVKPAHKPSGKAGNGIPLVGGGMAGLLTGKALCGDMGGDMMGGDMMGGDMMGGDMMGGDMMGMGEKKKKKNYGMSGGYDEEDFVNDIVEDQIEDGIEDKLNGDDGGGLGDGGGDDGGALAGIF